MSHHVQLVVILAAFFHITFQQIRFLSNFTANEEKLSNSSPTPVEESKLYSCQVCKNLGKQCLGKKVADCEFCAKVIGELEDAKNVPDWAKSYVNVDSAKSIDVSQYVNKTVVFRMCLNSAILDLFGLKPTVGCRSFTVFGFTGRGCLCRGDCLYPLNLIKTDIYDKNV